MNIDKDLSGNDMNLDDDVLYNFTDASSQLIRDDDITSWRGLQKKHPLFFQSLIDAFSKPDNIVADLNADTCINILFLLLNYFTMSSLQTDIFSFIDILIIDSFLFDKTIHTCLPCFEASPLGIGR